MTAKDAKRELERAGSELDKAITLLVSMPAEVSSWPASLRTASESLQRTRAEFPALGEVSGCGPLLVGLKSRVKQVHALLESAALFYCGCVAISAPEGSGYNCEGALEQSVLSGRMQLEA